MAIQFYLTSAGRNAALNAASLGLNVSLTHIAVGTGKYDPSNAMTLTNAALVSEIERYPLNGGSVEPVSHTLRFVANIEPTQTADGFEIGLITSQGVLFAIASTTSNTPLIRLVANIVSVVTFGMILSNLNLSNLIITVDPNTPIAVALMNQHLDSVDPHPQYATKSLVNSLIDLNVDNAVDYLVSLLNLHQTVPNPHPQYLLASTFGVDLLMNASVNTPLIDENRVFGWNGTEGDVFFQKTNVTWWANYQETVTFKPWRSYGTFLLWLFLDHQGHGIARIKIFNNLGVELSDDLIFEESRASYGYHAPPIFHVFSIPKGGYAEIFYRLEVWNKHKGQVKGTVYVDDRPKSFMPVGYQSSVDIANDFQDDGVSEESTINYDDYPMSEWSRFSSRLNAYEELSDTTSFTSPEVKTPHFHRNLFAADLNIELWIVLEVGLQTVQSPSDYVAVETQVVRASTDDQGRCVVQIPLSMRSIATPNNETLVYKIAYYLTQVNKTINDSAFPAGNLDGIHEFYVRH